MNRYGKMLLVSLVTSSFIVAPVCAAPETGSLESQKEAAENEADALQQELVELLDKMGKLEEDLITKGEEVIQAEESLKDAQELEELQYEAMKLRIKYMYEGGTTTALETLISAESFADLLNRAEYVAEVHFYDRSKLKEYETTKQKVEDLKEQLVEEQSNMQNMQVEYEAKEAALVSTLEDKREEIAEFDQQIQAAAEAAAKAAAEREACMKMNAAGAPNLDGVSDRDDIDRVIEADPEHTGNTGASDAGNIGDAVQTGGGSDSSDNTDSAEGDSSQGNISAAQTIVNAAYSQLGVPYVYGGNGNNGGWDCSGLVQYCHSMAGISLPRTSEAQGGCGIPVSNPQPGDIVCYGGHVGIYIGDGQMIHAPKPGDCVKIAAVYGSPWYRRCW